MAINAILQWISTFSDCLFDDNVFIFKFSWAHKNNARKKENEEKLIFFHLSFG